MLLFRSFVRGQIWSRRNAFATALYTFDSLRHWLTIGIGVLWGYIDDYLNSEFDVSRCSYKLISSSLFAAHAEYVRWQIIYGLLQVRFSSGLHWQTLLLDSLPSLSIAEFIANKYVPRIGR